MATILSVATQKGGTGKSTTAINVACALETAGYRIKVVDTDPQVTFSKWFKQRRKSGRNGFDVVSIAKGFLAEELEAMREDPKLDMVIVDCPGNIEDITRAAVQLSDAVLSPLRPSAIDRMHSVDTARFIIDMRKAYPQLQFLLFINAAMRWNISKEAADTTRQILKNVEHTTVLKAEIPLTAAIAEFCDGGASIFEYAPGSASAKAYMKLTKEMIACLAAEK
jgi:chromosome partitioning protein